MSVKWRNAALRLVYIIWHSAVLRWIDALNVFFGRRTQGDDSSIKWKRIRHKYMHTRSHRARSNDKRERERERTISERKNKSCRKTRRNKVWLMLRLITWIRIVADRRRCQHPFWVRRASISLSLSIRWAHTAYLFAMFMSFVRLPLACEARLCSGVRVHVHASVCVYVCAGICVWTIEWRERAQKRGKQWQYSITTLSHFSSLQF